ncbi:hypothetical protein TNCV_925391 [Trichonephila clavipes]|nr:hypothetical protein TNCV_925391 [Trichonephila clavipes]
MTAVDFLHHENPLTWAESNLQPWMQKTSDKPITPPSRTLINLINNRFSTPTYISLHCCNNVTVKPMTKDGVGNWFFSQTSQTRIGFSKVVCTPSHDKNESSFSVDQQRVSP